MCTKFLRCWIVFVLPIWSQGNIYSQTVTVARPPVSNAEYLQQLSLQDSDFSQVATVASTGPKLATLEQLAELQPIPAGISHVQPTTDLRQPIQYASIQAKAPPATNDVVQQASHWADCEMMGEPDIEIIPDGCSTPICGAWTHYTTLIAEGLFIRPRNAEIAYAVPIDGPITAPPAANPIQIGQVGVVDPDYEIGYAFGGSLALNAVSSMEARFTTVEFLSSNAMQTAAPNVLRSLVSHPSSNSAATDFLSAQANLAIDYETIDVLLKHLFVGGGNYAVNYIFGARYGQLDQRFDATFVDNETETMISDIDFEGVGLRVGVEAEKHSCHGQLRFYARGMANFLAGRFRGNYFQGSSFDPEIVNTQWKAGRIIPTLDLEIGFGWRSWNDRFRVSAGYRVDAWMYMVTNEDFIWAVQQNNFLNLDDSISFDGLIAQAEWRF